jgi:hypothetical protein
VRRTSTETAALALFAGLLLASLPLLTHGWYDATNDGSMYLACARSLLAGEGYAYLGEPFRIRPPGLALLIAPVLALYGTDFLALNLWIGAFGALALVLLVARWRARLGPALALALGVALWLNEGWRRSSAQVMSEMPAMALVAAALVLERRAARTRRLVDELWTGVAIAAATYVRTMSALLAPALILARLVERRRARPAAEGPRAFALKRLALPAGSAFLLVLPWLVRDALVATPPPADQTMLHSYATGLFHEDGGDPESRRLGLGELAARLPKQLERTAIVLGSRLRAMLPMRTRQLPLGEQWGRAETLSASHVLWTALLLAGGLFGLLRRAETQDVFAWLALLVVLLYFGFDDRLLLPSFAFFLAASADALRAGLARLAGPGRGTVAAVLAVLALALSDFRPRAGWEEVRRQHQAFAEIAAEARALGLPAGRLGAPIGWHYAVYLERQVWSLDWSALRAARQDRPPAQALEELLRRRSLEGVLLSPLVEVDRAYLGWLRARADALAEGESAVVGTVRR